MSSDALLAKRRAAQQGVDPRVELGERERLGEIIVGAGIEAVDAVGHRVQRRQEQHRRPGAGRAQRS